MFVVTLKFSSNKSQAREFMDGRKVWLKRGFDDGIFLLAGSLQPNLGGGILAHNTKQRPPTSATGSKDQKSEKFFGVFGTFVGFNPELHFRWCIPWSDSLYIHG